MKKKITFGMRVRYYNAIRESISPHIQPKTVTTLLSPNELNDITSREHQRLPLIMKLLPSSTLKFHQLNTKLSFSLLNCSY